MLCRVYSHVGVNGENIRANIKGCALGGGDPVLVKLYQCFNGLYREFLVDFRNTETVAGEV